MGREDLHFRLRLPDELKKKVKESSVANSSSMTAEIVRILTAHYQGGEIDMRFQLDQIYRRLDELEILR